MGNVLSKVASVSEGSHACAFSEKQSLPAQQVSPLVMGFDDFMRLTNTIDEGIEQVSLLVDDVCESTERLLSCEGKSPKQATEDLRAGLHDFVMLLAKKHQKKITPVANEGAGEPDKIMRLRERTYDFEDEPPILCLADMFQGSDDEEVFVKNNNIKDRDLLRASHNLTLAGFRADEITKLRCEKDKQSFLYACALCYDGFSKDEIKNLLLDKNRRVLFAAYHLCRYGLDKAFVDQLVDKKKKRLLLSSVSLLDNGFTKEEVKSMVLVNDSRFVVAAEYLALKGFEKSNIQQWFVNDNIQYIVGAMLLFEFAFTKQEVNDLVSLENEKIFLQVVDLCQYHNMDAQGVKDNFFLADKKAFSSAKYLFDKGASMSIVEKIYRHHGQEVLSVAQRMIHCNIEPVDINGLRDFDKSCLQALVILLEGISKSGIMAITKRGRQEDLHIAKQLFDAGISESGILAVIAKGRRWVDDLQATIDYCDDVLEHLSMATNSEELLFVAENRVAMKKMSVSTEQMDALIGRYGEVFAPYFFQMLRAGFSYELMQTQCHAGGVNAIICLSNLVFAGFSKEEIEARFLHPHQRPYMSSAASLVGFGFSQADIMSLLTNKSKDYFCSLINFYNAGFSKAQMEQLLMCSEHIVIGLAGLQAVVGISKSGLLSLIKQGDARKIRQLNECFFKGKSTAEIERMIYKKAK